MRCTRTRHMRHGVVNVAIILDEPLLLWGDHDGRLARHALHEVKGGRVWQLPQELRRAALGAELVHSVRMPHVVAVIRLVQIVVALIALGQRHSLDGIAAGAAQHVFAVAAGHEHGLLGALPTHGWLETRFWLRMQNMAGW